MNLLQLLQVIVSHPLFLGVLVLLAANIIAGIAAALYLKDFHLAPLGDWLMSRAIPYILGGITMQLVVIALPEEMSGISSATGWLVWAFVIASLIGKIIENLRMMGMPLPAVLGDKPKIDASVKP